MNPTCRLLALATLLSLTACSKKDEEEPGFDDYDASLRQLLNHSDCIVEGSLESYDSGSRIAILKNHRVLRGQLPTPKTRLAFAAPMPLDSVRRHLVPGAPVIWFSNGSEVFAYLNRFFMMFYEEGVASEGKWNYSMVQAGMNRTFNGSTQEFSGLIRDILSGNTPSPEADATLKNIRAADLRALPVWGEPVDEDYLPRCFRRGKPTPRLLRPPEDPPGLIAGLRTTTFQGPWVDSAKIDGLEPLEKGVAESLSVGAFPRTESLRVRFQGYLGIPRDGVYVFTLAGDSNSFVTLSIGSTEVVSVSRHSSKHCGGEIALKTGKHAFRLTCAAGEAERSFQVFWAGPGFTRQLIPATSLFREK